MKKLILSIALVTETILGAADTRLVEIKNTLDQEVARMAKLFLCIPESKRHIDDLRTYEEVYFTRNKLLHSKPFSPTYGQPLDDALFAQVTEVYNAIKAGKYINWNPRPIDKPAPCKPIPQSSSSCSTADEESDESQEYAAFEQQFPGAAFVISLIASGKPITNEDVDTIYELCPAFKFPEFTSKP